jgi:hypothetical protein
VPRLDGGGPSATNSFAEQASAAEEMATCLQRLGVPSRAQSDGVSQGQKQLVFDTDDAHLWSLGDGTGGALAAAGTISQDEWRSQYSRLEELASKYEPGDGAQPVYLFIGEEDYSEPFAECLAKTRYREPVYEEDPRQELVFKERQLEATLDWVKCARNNGYPSIEDPSPPQADNWSTQPMALLPGDLTADEVRKLLDNCPNFDQQTYQNMFDDLIELGPEASDEERDDVLLRYQDSAFPLIGFDLPGCDGAAGSETSEASDLDTGNPDYLRCLDLRGVLTESENEFVSQVQARLRQAGFGTR